MAERTKPIMRSRGSDRTINKKNWQEIKTTIYPNVTGGGM